jgi:uncharacterized protein (DUF2336 family)
VSKLRVNIYDRSLEVEGSDEEVRRWFAEFCDSVKAELIERTYAIKRAKQKALLDERDAAWRELEQAKARYRNADRIESLRSAHDPH